MSYFNWLSNKKNMQKKEEVINNNLNVLTKILHEIENKIYVLNENIKYLKNDEDFMDQFIFFYNQLEIEQLNYNNIYYNILNNSELDVENALELLVNEMDNLKKINENINNN